ncbi:signal peptidase I [Dongia mobilis]|uniref:Signal peptidase I n=1 Tax=Dongia mobilis TaxID=578943 RepID=A0A4V3DDX9_9PROT|nr:signal peptidase I [Dongia mobilis]TDQ78611.1 signal peptidase I [Dongia mobilis]
MTASAPDSRSSDSRSPESRPTVSRPADPRLPVRPRRAWVIVLLTILAPGLGHLHAGYWRFGIANWVVMAGTGLGLALAFHLVWPGALAFSLWFGFNLLVLLVAMTGAVRLARRDHRLRADRPLPRPWQYGAFILGALAAGFALAQMAPPSAVIEAFSIPTRSGLPNLVPGDRILAAKSPAHRAVLRRGDLILYAMPADPEATFIHRLIGLPGDVLAFTADGHLTLNGGPLLAQPAGPPAEAAGLGGRYQLFRETLPGGDDAAPGSVTYLIRRSEGVARDHGSFTVPEGHVFVLGDNRDNAMDSRVMGPVAIGDIVGIASFVYWPGDGGDLGRDWSRLGRSLLPELEAGAAVP